LVQSVNLLQRAPWLAGPCAYGVHASRGMYQAVMHSKLISDAFRRTALKKAGRLLIIAPVRHGKSTTAVHYGSSWLLTLMPHWNLLFGTYAANFAALWGERVRNTVSEQGASIGVTLGSRNARDEWTLKQGGGMRSVGVGQKIAGRGADLLLFDDLVGSAQEALSRVQQDAIWQWWLGDFTSRRQSMDMPIIGIGARWAEDDHMGRLLRAYEEGPGTEGYEPWEILYLPAIWDGYDWTGKRECEDPIGREMGDALWPEKWSREWLDTIQASRPWWFASQYQGRPLPLEGGLFKQSMWPYWRVDGEDFEDLGPVIVGGDEKDAHTLPALTRVIVSVDANFLADMAELSKGRERSDVAVHVLGLDARGNKYVLDRETSMMDLDGTAQCVLAMRERYRPGTPTAEALGMALPPLVAYIEAKANGPAVMAKLRRKGVVCVPVTPVEGKVARVVGRGDTQAHKFGRATALLDDVQAGKVLLPHPAMVIDGRSYDWSLDLRHKLAQFRGPGAGSDDADALSQGWAKLESIDWRADAANESNEQRAVAKMVKAARLPKGSELPTNTQELMAMRAKATVDKRLAEMEKRFNRRGRRMPF
jgi:hypothetical protein